MTYGDRGWAFSRLWLSPLTLLFARARLYGRQIPLEPQQCAKRCAVNFHLSHCDEPLANSNMIDAIGRTMVAQPRARDQFADRGDGSLKDAPRQTGQWPRKSRGSHVCKCPYRVGDGDRRPGPCRCDHAPAQ